MIHINIVDAPCGYGKTTWAIQTMNEASKDSHSFIYITPFLDEVSRVKESVKKRTFYEPTSSKGVKKLDDFHELLRQNKDICTTHALFQNANKETRELIAKGNYTLILDEVMNVIEQVELKKDDLDLLRRSKVISIEENKNGIKYIKWNEADDKLDTKFNKERNMALTGNLLYFSDKVLMWNLPCDIFRCFKHVYLLTYLFSGQIQRYYYDLHQINYRYLSVINDGGSYNLVPYDYRKKVNKKKLSELINVFDDNKLNNIGAKSTALSSTALKKDTDNIKRLKLNAYNFFTNIVKANARNSLWTTVLHAKDKVSPRNFKSAFIPVNTRATNEYKDRYNLAYLINRYMLVMDKRFFDEYGVKVDQDTWALSELIQWIWRSRIREGYPINLYIPSKRMRTLLLNYLDSERFEEPPEGSITNQYESDWNM